jgi:hypothetical protein
MSLLNLLKMLEVGSPCAGAPTISTVSISNTQAGDCATTFAQWTVTVTLSGAITGYELEYYVCVSDVASCTPTYRATQTGLTYVYEHPQHQQAAGSGATTFYANATVKLVPVGRTEICDEMDATQQSANPYRGCFD